MMMIISCFATAGIGNDFHAAFFDPVVVPPWVAWMENILSCWDLCGECWITLDLNMRFIKGSSHWITPHDLSAQLKIHLTIMMTKWPEGKCFLKTIWITVRNIHSTMLENLFIYFEGARLRLFQLPKCTAVDHQATSFTFLPSFTGFYHSLLRASDFVWVLCMLGQIWNQEKLVRESCSWILTRNTKS